jgi:hypothetical protein
MADVQALTFDPVQLSSITAIYACCLCVAAGWPPARVWLRCRRQTLHDAVTAINTNTSLDAVLLYVSHCCRLTTSKGMAEVNVTHLVYWDC